MKSFFRPAWKVARQSLLRRLNGYEKDSYRFGYTVEEMVAMHDQAVAAVEKGLGQLFSSDFLKYKTSDTIFLLGSGPSISDIESEQWEFIRRKDSIGFNFFLAHPFVPRFFMYQEAGDAMRETLRRSRERYKGVPFIVRGSRFASGGLGEASECLDAFEGSEVFFLRELPISSDCGISPKGMFRFVEIQGYLSHGVIANFVPKWGCTLGLLLSWAFQMGYKKIVLCGMDMQNGNHFWDEPSLEYLKKDYPLPGPSPLHTFTDPRLRPITVPDYVYSFAEWALDRANVNIFVSSPRTVLYPKIPLFDF